MESKEDTWNVLSNEIIPFEDQRCKNCAHCIIIRTDVGFIHDENNRYHHNDNPPPECVKCRVDHDGKSLWATRPQSNWKQNYDL